MSNNTTDNNTSSKQSNNAGFTYLCTKCGKRFNKRDAWVYHTERKKNPCNIPKTVDDYIQKHQKLISRDYEILRVINTHPSHKLTNEEINQKIAELREKIRLIIPRILDSRNEEYIANIPELLLIKNNLQSFRK
jgi:hypothetical protein